MADTETSDKVLAGRWYMRGRVALASARRLFLAGDVYGCANRAYYATYQACVGACVAHGDADKFPAEWNNPTHDQLPDLIKNNGDFTTQVRDAIKTRLIALRGTREDADYRVGRSVTREEALKCLIRAEAVFNNLKVDTEEP